MVLWLLEKVSRHYLKLFLLDKNNFMTPLFGGNGDLFRYSKKCYSMFHIIICYYIILLYNNIQYHLLHIIILYCYNMHNIGE